MGTKATDHFNAEWQMWLNAGAEKSGVMRQDALPSTHPILQPIVNENQANDAFDGITYIKGQSFLRMLENYLGEEKFRDGMKLYMSRHRYSSTTTADLWAALEKASGKPSARFRPGGPSSRLAGRQYRQPMSGGKNVVASNRNASPCRTPTQSRCTGWCRIALAI
jgi:aminopeptidase N